MYVLFMCVTVNYMVHLLCDIHVNNSRVSELNPGFRVPRGLSDYCVRLTWKLVQKLWFCVSLTLEMVQVMKLRIHVNSEMN